MGIGIVMPSILETERLLLRPWLEADAAVYRDLWSERDPRSLRVIDADGKPTIDDLRKSIRTDLIGSASTGLRLLVVERRLEKDFIGYCGLIHRQKTPEEPEIAYELLRREHGCGYNGGRQRGAGRRAPNRPVPSVGWSPELELCVDPGSRQDRVHGIRRGQ